MQIIWHGQSFFEIAIKSTNNVETKIAIDPYGENIGLKLYKIAADILLISHQHSDHNNAKAIIGAPFLINSPGEYEVKDVFIRGIAGFHDSTEGKKSGEVIIYKLEIEGLKLCHLSDLGQKELTPEQLEQIGAVDILMIPVGGTFTIDAKQASQIVAQIEPRVVIPMHYKLPNLNVQIDGVDKFLKIMGAEKTMPEKKLKITPRLLPLEETKIIILEP